jgi:hypothetical protein
MVTQAQSLERDERVAVLDALIGSSGDRCDRLRALHPDRALFTSHPQRESLEFLFWRELVQLEQANEAPLQPWLASLPSSPAAYFLRRRELETWCRWKLFLEPLPARWRTLFALGTAKSRELCVELGLRAIAASASGRDPATLLVRLQPLGPQIALAVIERVHAAKDVLPTETAVAVRDSLATLASARRGESLLAALGRSLVAARLAAAVSVEDLELRGAGYCDLLVRLAVEQPLPTLGAEARFDAWIDDALAALHEGESHGDA